MAKSKKNAAAVALGRLGGLRGGKARAKKLTAKQRKYKARGGCRRARCGKINRPLWREGEVMRRFRFTDFGLVVLSAF